jgi:histidinol-phosphate/aromatic aminotransferase/cobyric acid decarboxylase-like protein/GTP:adenosylcobinamide-phosphate guanylyltransferase
MQAIILAAGLGKRLKELTSDNTKCMIKVNGTTLIERMLSQLSKIHLKRIIIVVGYKGKKLMEFIDELHCSVPIEFIENPIYDKTNNIYSLALASSSLLEDDTLLLESDIIFEDAILKLLVDDPRPSLALVDKYESWMDGTVVTLGDDDSIRSFIPGRKLDFSSVDAYFKTVNIYKFSKKFSTESYVPFLRAYQSALGCNEYYEQVLRVITMLDDCELKAKRLSGQLWYEIDDIQDLDIASSMFTSRRTEKLDCIQTRFGGYWRYPKLLDFCYLVNPYYPPKRLIEEMQASFGTILAQYPSGMRVNSLLAAKNFGISQDRVVVGNGAAELIKSLVAVLGECRYGVIRPTFEEYPNRIPEDRQICFYPSSPDLRYGINELISFFSTKRIDVLLLINPDNPSGNYIPKADVLRLAIWCQRNNIRLIVDESFVDFASEDSASLLHDTILDQYQHIVVVKSISKSFGVPGLRLGIIASGDTQLISLMKNDVSIWNINSFAEFYMQIEEKYQNEYQSSLIRTKESRRLLMERLMEINNISVLPSEANYCMIRLSETIDGKDLATNLLCDHNILIKELTKKIDSHYIRVAVRNDEDNAILVDALKIEIERMQ